MPVMVSLVVATIHGSMDHGTGVLMVCSSFYSLAYRGTVPRSLGCSVHQPSVDG